MTLLSINIPTYERLESFSSVISELAEEIGGLENSIKELVQIRIIDNDSICFSAKKQLCNKLSNKFNINICIKKNTYNLGGSVNVHNCYIASPYATFTWVLGDDDHVVDGSLRYITNILLNHQDDLGLLILSGEEYVVHPDILKKQVFNSYYDLAVKAVKVQPHLLIAHTLISCNIFRSVIFIESESLYAINTLYLRYGHWTGFSHMRGLVSGLLRGNFTVIIPKKNVLDVRRRESDVDFGEQIFEIYYFYFLWLLTEIGVRLDQIKSDKSMNWLSRGPHFKLFIFRKRLKIRERLRRVLINLIGVEMFINIRSKLKSW
jgi:hypothetical protein